MKAVSQLVLGSGSPRRKELLALFGMPFSVRPAEINEAQLPGEAAEDFVARLAGQKAASNGLEPQEALIAADTTVAFEGRLIGKPRDAAEALEFLENMRGRCHQVHSAVCLRYQERQQLESCITAVYMRHYSPDELDAYITSEDWRDKAGGYAIQHAGFHPVECIEGCHANVMGLPLCSLQNLFEAVGLAGNPDIARDCMRYLQIDCPVWREIRRIETA